MYDLPRHDKSGNGTTARGAIATNSVNLLKLLSQLGLDSIMAGPNWGLSDETRRNSI